MSTMTRIPMSADEAAQMTSREHSDDDYVRAAREALERPSNYAHWGDDRMFESVGLTIGHSRDSDTVEESNYRCVLRDMSALAEYLYPGEGDDRVSEHSVSHWAFGWVEKIAVRVLIDPAQGIESENLTPEFVAVTNIAKFLSDEYPVYDDSDHSELESEHNYDVWQYCVWPDFYRNAQEIDRCQCDDPSECLDRPEPLDSVDADALYSEVSKYASEYDPSTWTDEDIWDGIVRLAVAEAYGENV